MIALQTVIAYCLLRADLFGFHSAVQALRRLRNGAIVYLQLLRHYICVLDGAAVEETGAAAVG